ncbi:DUF3306 domain-containing protein [Halomonas pacifica]|uniref:DUF3306 domain-containing protein n=1 Tax=Bisbaumannia pacifica TaxID=77098 RepID=UPI002359A27A|nr:DUF3306 domain-containing protein [Halomonas pacifica]MDC8804868.1 DUF3306 domain-containing protein [Halomonas pacifica]
MRETAMNRLARWSERKREAAQAEKPEAAPPAEEPGDIVEAAPHSGEADPLPDPDDLAPGSEISAFMASGVGEALRRRALRRLFAGEQYGVRDGLDDYDDDYRRLQPLAGELADRLRRWTRPTEETAQEDPAQKETAQDDLSTEADGDPVPGDLASAEPRDAGDDKTRPDPPQTLDQG